MEVKKSKLPYLSDDVITEIILRSPIKSVGRFKCLSKLFCSLLSDPKIARKQLELTLRRNRSETRRVIMSSQKLFLVDLDSIDVEREYSFKEDLTLLSKVLTRDPKFKNKMSFLSNPGMYIGWGIYIMGSSNGLVCIKCVRTFREEEVEVLLYNPTTRDCKRIPELSESVYCKSHQLLFCNYGLGFDFDALTNDYKVVKLVSCREKEHKNTVCYVYSLKTHSWRRINDLLPYYYHVSVSSANLKGAIHWIARIQEDRDRKVIIAFDLEKEELREMPLPNWPEEFDHDMRSYVVDTFKGCLCVVHDCFMMHNIIWVMNEYGVESSWSKIRINVSKFSIKPLCLDKNDEEVLVVLDGNFVYRKFKTPDEEFYIKIKSSMYVESLISPNSYGEQI